MSHPQPASRFALQRKLEAIEKKAKELEQLLLEASKDADILQTYYRCTTRLREVRSQLQEH